MASPPGGIFTLSKSADFGPVQDHLNSLANAAGRSSPRGPQRLDDFDDDGGIDISDGKPAHDRACKSA
jgi:hypothetical protein